MNTKRNSEKEDAHNGVAEIDRAAGNEIGGDWIHRTEDAQYGLTNNPPHPPGTERPCLQPPPKKHKQSPASFPTIGKHNGNEPGGTQDCQSARPGSANMIESTITLLNPTLEPADASKLRDDVAEPSTAPAKNQDDGDRKPAAKTLTNIGSNKMPSEMAKWDPPKWDPLIGGTWQLKRLYRAQEPEQIRFLEPPSITANGTETAKILAAKTLTNIGSNKMPSEMAKQDPLVRPAWHTWRLKRLYRAQEPEQIRSLEPPSITANGTETGRVLNRKEFTEEELEALEIRAKFRSGLQPSNKISPNRKRIVPPRLCRFAASAVANEIIDIESDTEQPQQRNATCRDVTLVRNATCRDVTLSPAGDVDITIENYRHMGLTTLQSPRTTHWETRMAEALRVNIPPTHMSLYLRQLLKAPPGTNFSTVAFSVPPHTKFEVIPPSSKKQHRSLQWLDTKYSEEVHPNTFYDNQRITTHLASLIPAMVTTKQDKTGACLVHKRHQYDSMVVQALLNAVPFLVRCKRRLATKIFTLYKFDNAKLNLLIKRIEMSEWYVAKERTPVIKPWDTGGKTYDEHTEFLYNLLDFAYPVNAINTYTAESETLWCIPRHIADWVFLFPQQVSETYYEKRLQNSFVPPPKARELYSCK
jgi:hypothetical protein